MRRRNYVSSSEKMMTAVLVLIVALGFSGLAYGHWQDTLYFNGTIRTAAGLYQKTFVLTLTCNNPWIGLTYYGAIQPSGGGPWTSVQLALSSGEGSKLPGNEASVSDPDCICRDKVLTGTIADLSGGQYNWRIYTFYDGAQVTVGQGTEQISQDVTNFFTFGVTSLEVSKTVTGVQKMADGRYKLSGTITITNDDEHYAVILLVNDTVQYRAGGTWLSIRPDVFVCTPVSLIAPGATVTLSYYAIFDSSKPSTSEGGFDPLCPPQTQTQYRNLAEVTLFNHPLGIHVFHDTVSFTLPP
jgi:hypothetical protein